MSLLLSSPAAHCREDGGSERAVSSSVTQLSPVRPQSHGQDSAHQPRPRAFLEGVWDRPQTSSTSQPRPFPGSWVPGAPFFIVML